MKKYALILAGGKGTRLWPISSEANPKQLMPLISSSPMIVDTINRIKENFENNNIFVITSKTQSENIHSCLKDIIPISNIIVEPIQNGTAACVLYAIMLIKDLYGDGIVSIFSSDHYIEDIPKWNQTIMYAINYVEENDVIATIGIMPKDANTGYGYILKDYELEKNIYAVKKFVEKPSKEKAVEYVRTGRYLWNSGNFITKISFLVSLYKFILPDMYNLMNTIKLNKWERNMLENNYRLMEKTSIDYGILEKTDKLVTIQTEVFWSDIGTLNSLIDIVKKDNNLNYSNNESLFIESCNNFIYSKNKFVVALGMQDCVIIENNGLIIITTKERVEEIKDLAHNDILNKYL